MTEGTKRCAATPSWSIAVPVQFSEINNSDSWQATADTRCVYVSSIKVGGGDKGPPPASALCAASSSTLGKAPSAERLRFEQSAMVGAAAIQHLDIGFELRAVMCVDGCVATCVINFENHEHRNWAIETWQSLRAVEKKPWWRLW
jgi:hypothetical protein